MRNKSQKTGVSFHLYSASLTSAKQVDLYLQFSV